MEDQTYIAYHGDVPRLGDDSLHVAGTFRSKKRRNPVADHVCDDASRHNSIPPRVVPTHHQSHVGEDVWIVIDLH